MEPTTQQSTPPTQQPTAPVQQSPQPSQETASKSSKMPILIVSVIVLATLALGGGIFLMSSLKPSQNTAAVTTAPSVPTPTVSQAQASVENIPIEDVSGDLTELEGNLQNL